MTTSSSMTAINVYYNYKIRNPWNRCFNIKFAQSPLKKSGRPSFKFNFAIKRLNSSHLWFTTSHSTKMRLKCSFIDLNTTHRVQPAVMRHRQPTLPPPHSSGTCLLHVPGRHKEEERWLIYSLSCLPEILLSCYSFHANLHL